MRLFKIKPFHRWATKEGVTDASLVAAVAEMEKGLIDANLGGNVYKKRVAVGGRGKSGGVRTLLAYKTEDRAFFIYGFAKNKRANISHEELRALKLFASELLNYTDRKLVKALAVEELIEVNFDE